MSTLEQTVADHEKEVKSTGKSVWLVKCSRLRDTRAPILFESEKDAEAYVQKICLALANQVFHVLDTPMAKVSISASCLCQSALRILDTAPVCIPELNHPVPAVALHELSKDLDPESKASERATRIAAIAAKYKIPVRDVGVVFNYLSEQHRYFGGRALVTIHVSMRDFKQHRAKFDALAQSSAENVHWTLTVQGVDLAYIDTSCMLKLMELHSNVDLRTPSALTDWYRLAMGMDEDWLYALTISKMDLV